MDCSRDILNFVVTQLGQGARYGIFIRGMTSFVYKVITKRTNAAAVAVLECPVSDDQPVRGRRSCCRR